MNKFTKIVAALAMAAAVLSCAACSNNGASSDSSAASDAVKTSEASTVSTAEASTADVSAASTAEVQAPVTAEAPAFDVTKMYGNWVLAAINDGTNTMNVADFAASLNATVESCMVEAVIDENSYSSTTLDSTSTFSYTVNDNGITVDMDGIELPVVYDEETDSIAYGIATDEVTYKYVLMRNTDDASATTAEAAATAQAAATAEAAE